MTTPVVDLESRVYVVPTETPESDGTLTWDATTVVVARAHVAGVSGLGFTYGSHACAGVICDPLRDVVARTEGPEEDEGSAVVEVLRAFVRWG